MIELVPPTKELLVQLIKRLIEGEVSREELVAWQNAVVVKFGYSAPGILTVPLTVDDGYWEFVSFCILLEKGHFNGEPFDYFVRLCDLQEWLAFLLRDGSPEEVVGPFKRIRWNAPPPREQFIALIEYSDPLAQTFASLSVTKDRLIWDDLGDLTEGSFVEFEGWHFVVRKSHLHNPGKVTIEGETLCPHAIAGKFVLRIGVAQSMLSWVSEFAFTDPYLLTRIDDNANEFLVCKMNNYIEAILCQASYEAKGHKQLYVVQRALSTGQAPSQ